MERFNQTSIVIVEITPENKAPEIQYVTIGSMGKKTSDLELAKEALKYVTVKGLKEVKQIIVADSDDYKHFLERNVYK